MLKTADKPIFTRTYDRLDQFIPEPGSVYFYAEFEERSQRSDAWLAASSDVVFVKLTLSPTSDHFDLQLRGSGDSKRYSLKSLRALNELFLEFPNERFYIDITGFSHKLWMPLIRAGLATERSINAVYSEPEKYSYSSAPTFGDFFDLSERIEGIAPIPTFTTFGSAADKDTVFIPMLSFEGNRFAYVTEQVQAPKIFPILGVPGFRLEYPFHALFSNHRTLLDSESWRNIRTVNASCPFSLFYKLQDLKSEHANSYFKVAPMGTKPHALGALLFYIRNNTSTEMVYDHPKRAPGRTTGFGKSYLYYLSEFMTAK